MNGGEYVVAGVVLALTAMWGMSGLGAMVARRRHGRR
jgi:hypothetical protein